jgi:hypothetical protein
MARIDIGADHRDPATVRHEDQTYLADGGAGIRRLHVKSDEAEQSVGR